MDLFRRQSVLIPEKKKEKSKKQLFLFILFSLLLSIIFIFSFYRLIAFPYRIKSEIMVPALSKNQLVWIRWNYADTFNRDEIVFLKSPLFSAQDDAHSYISRIRGLPGETIRIKNKKVYINGKILNSKFFFHSEPDRIFPAGISERDNLKEIRIPQNHYFVIGDNWDASFDSRHFGTISSEKIVGKITD
jgi:signal peptidase I